MLKRAKEVETLLAKGEFRLAGEAFLRLISGRFEEIEDFTALVDLADLSPQLFRPPSRSLESWRSDFEDFLEYEKSFLLNDLDDPDQFDGEMDAIQYVADALGVDIDEFAASAAERAEELRAESGMYEPDEDEWRELYSGTPEVSADREVDSLFQSLL